MARKIDHEKRKREIAETAIRLFSQVGFDNVSLIMIAASVGVSRTALYRYFCSKREVMDAAITHVTDQIAAAASRILLGRSSVPEKLEQVCHNVVEVMFANKAFVIAIFDFVLAQVRTGGNMTDAMALFTGGTRESIRRLVEHGKRTGVFSPELLPERAVDVLYSGFESAAMRIVLGTERDAAAAKRRFTDIIRAITVWRATVAPGKGKKGVA